MLGEMVEVTGKISPKVSGVKDIITYTKPDSSTQSREVTTDSDGTYHDTHALDRSGSWMVHAAWEGDSTHHGATSEVTQLSVEEKTQTGIPGYPFESLILGMVLVLLVLGWYGQSILDGR